MHGRSIFIFLRLFISFELNFLPPRPRSNYISGRIGASTGVCRHQQLSLPGLQEKQPNLSCI